MREKPGGDQPEVLILYWTSWVEKG